MFGIILISLGTLLVESASSFGKYEVAHHKEGVFGMGFLNTFMVLVFLIIGVLCGNEFRFSVASLITFIPRVLFEIIGITISLFAIAEADRSTFNYLRTVTIPLLLFVDVIIFRNSFSTTQLVGVVLITCTIIAARYEHLLNKSGFWLSLATGIIAVVTISLYKYDITHFNSVSGEQSIVVGVLLVYTFILSIIRGEKNPFRLLIHPKFFIQSSTIGVGGLMEAFAYAYAPASIITTGKRAMGMVWGMISGWKFFGEKKLLQKLITMSFLIVGVYLLI